MDYIITSKLTIDTETKKNAVRDALISLYETNTANGTLKAWNLDLEGVLVSSKDNESYSSED